MKNLKPEMIEKARTAKTAEEPESMEKTRLVQ